MLCSHHVLPKVKIRGKTKFLLSNLYIFLDPIIFFWSSIILRDLYLDTLPPSPIPVSRVCSYEGRVTVLSGEEETLCS